MVANETEAAMAQAVKVVHHLLDAPPVIHANVGHVAARGAHVIEDHRDSAVVELVHQFGRHFGNDGRQTGDPPPDHQAHTGDQLFAAVVRVGHHYFIAAGVGIALDGLVDVEEKRVFHVGDNHTNGAAFAPRQAAGMEVRMVFQFLDGFYDPGTGRAFDYACIIKHPRDRGGGNFGPPGHLFKVHGYCLYCTRVKSLLGPTKLQLAHKLVLDRFRDSAYTNSKPACGEVRLPDYG